MFCGTRREVRKQSESPQLKARGTVLFGESTGLRGFCSEAGQESETPPHSAAKDPGSELTPQREP